MYFFAFNLEKFTPDRIFYTGSARGARDKYEVWVDADTGHEEEGDAGKEDEAESEGASNSK